MYIDGYLTGTVDDFDGTFQRLHVAPGAHELTLYRDGFKTVHQSLQLSSGATFKVSYNMEPLAAGEVPEARPTPPPPPPSDQGEGVPSARLRLDSVRRLLHEDRLRRASAAGFGTLAIRVQPADAIVLIDGERWQTSSGQDRLVVEVPAGSASDRNPERGLRPVLDRDHDVAGRNRTDQRQPAITLGQG